MNTSAFVGSKSVEDILEDKLLHLREIEFLGNRPKVVDGERGIRRKGNRALERDGCRENTVCNICRIISLVYYIHSPAVIFTALQSLTSKSGILISVEVFES